MTINIEKLRAALAATTQGEWVIADEIFVTTNSLPKDEYVGRAETKVDALGIALTHNEFPAMLDEIERLRKEKQCVQLDLDNLRNLHSERLEVLRQSRATVDKLRTLLSQTIEVFNDACDCGECGPCKLREEIEGVLK